MDDAQGDRKREGEATDSLTEAVHLNVHLTAKLAELNRLLDSERKRCEALTTALRDYIDCVNSGHYEAICEAEHKARAALAEPSGEREPIS
jgi:hypothetical protein